MGPVRFSGSDKGRHGLAAAPVPFKAGEPYDPDKVEGDARQADLARHVQFGAHPAAQSALDANGELPFDVELTDRLSALDDRVSASATRPSSVSISGFWTHHQSCSVRP